MRAARVDAVPERVDVLELGLLAATRRRPRRAIVDEVGRRTDRARRPARSRGAPRLGRRRRGSSRPVVVARGEPARVRDVRPRAAPCSVSQPTVDARAGRCPGTSRSRYALDRARRPLDLRAVAELALRRGSPRGRRPRRSARLGAAIRCCASSLRKRAQVARASRSSGSPESVAPPSTARRTRRSSTPCSRTKRVERGLVLQVQVLLALPHAVERRLRDVEVALLEELRHLPVEEREQQRADVADRRRRRRSSG